MQIQLLVVSEDKEEWLRFAQAQYLKKINHFCDFKIEKIKPFKEAREEINEKKQREAERVLKKISPKDYVILCDEKGAEFNSLRFSKNLQKIQEHYSNRRVVFVIGGAYGVDDTIKTRAQETICLSKMTMNHFVAQIFLLEQIYRGFMILKGLPYHNE